MAAISLQSLYQLAIQHHQAGQLKEAEKLYRQILSQQADHPDALHMIGVLALQVGQNNVAQDFVRRAIALNPPVSTYHCNLGLILNALGRFHEAAQSLTEALRIDPNLAEAHNNLGIALWQCGDRDRALGAWQKAIRLKPNLAEAHNALGNALQQSGQFEQAIDAFQTAVRLSPKLADAYNNLGIAMKRQGKPKDAVAAFSTAIRIQPQNAEYYDNLGSTLWALGQIPDALQAYRKAVELQPQRAGFHSHLASAHWAGGDLDQAIESINKANELDPNSADVHANLGNILKDLGNVEVAIKAYRHAVELRPNDAAIHSSLIYLLHFNSPYSAELIGVELKRWQVQHAEPFKSEIKPFQNDRDPNRRLRIGYISPDFREHAVGRFMLPILRNHDRQQFEIYCYSDVAAPDELTKQTETLADHWKVVTGQSDATVADVIRQDRIDILIDPTAHTPSNRLLVFARKPAPLQVTYLSYPGTTGLETIDYRITDAHLDPPDRPNTLYSEASLYLPATYWCYEAPATSPEVNALPAIQNGYVTFGCLNTFRKVTFESLRAWSKILLATERSHLLLSLAEGSQRALVLEFFQSQGIDRNRIEFVSQLPLQAYLQTYRGIDIGLDPFPYTGGTTTCDALWMGVPVVSLAGEIAIHRGGVTLLNNVGLSEMIATSLDRYIDVAAGLARDLSRLGELRAKLRQQMEHSPLMDTKRFTHDLELTYRSIWQRWC